MVENLKYQLINSINLSKSNHFLCRKQGWNQKNDVEKSTKG
jgi:hypothetical protein